MQLHVDAKNRHSFLFLTGIFVLIAVLGIGQDLLHSSIHHSGFYWSESTLFKIVWLLFIPAFWLVGLVFSYSKDVLSGFGHIGLILLFSTIASIAHIGLTSVFIFFLSAILFDHTYAPMGVMRFFFADNFYLIWSIYCSMWIILHFLKKKYDQAERRGPGGTAYIRVISHQKIVPVRINDILYIEADRPYIAIVTKENRYLHNATLAGILEQLGAMGFVRIHRSRIVNIRYIDYLRSRANGDYDLFMHNGASIRMSRNYSSDLKARLDEGPSPA